VGRLLAEVVSPYATALGAVERARGGTEAMSRIQVDGRVLELRICPSIQNGVLQGLACALLDVTEQERANAELDRLALADPLTGLPNRTLLRDRLRLALRSAQRGNGRVGVLFLDLDDFKQVNDDYGHQAGDSVLRDVSARIASTLRGSDTLGRMGGDEFAIVLRTASADAASAVAARVQAAMTGAFMANGTGLHIGVSIGIAVAPDSGTDADELLRCADMAMFVAKRSGSGQRTYAVEMDEPAVRK